MNYVAATGDVVDASVATNEVANGGAVAAADGVKPTFTANRTALNTIVLTFSETVTSGGVDTDSFTVAGASAVSASVVSGGVTITLTTTGLTSTSSTPAVNYVAATGDVVDASVATNEVANGGAVAAADGVAPTISSTDITSADGTYILANDIDLTLTFSEAVTITGSPRIELNVTNATRYATYLSGTGTTAIVFRYTVQSGDAATDLGAVSTAGLALNSGTILDASSNAATLTLPNDLTAANAVAVNTLVGSSNLPSGGGGGGGGSAAPATPAVPAVPAVTPAIPATPAVPEIPATPDASVELPEAAAPVAVLIHDPSKFDELLAALGTASNPSEFAKYKALVKSDALAFKVGLTDAQQTTIANFVTYGASTATVKLGSGERRAVVRDYLETVGRSDVIWDDVQRMSTGQKLVNRNLAKEQAQVNNVLANFKKMVGHTPNFKVPAEDIAWNTMMYRIRFPRDLNLEKQGITKFKTLYNRIPSTPMDWSIVRALGYALK
ncbi:MAG: hypothetical protein NTX72_04605 [Candidatus Uhrbacteria bacterium]|nr:hypothetical protein [Candidatus Uhrbacteria bacterium]